MKKTILLVSISVALSGCLGSENRNESASSVPVAQSSDKAMVKAIQQVGKDFGAVLPPPSSGSDTISVPTNNLNEASPIGTNMEALRSWSAEWVFIDAFAKSREWIWGDCPPRSAWTNGSSLSVDKHGWPQGFSQSSRTCPHTLIFDNQSGKYPAGTYVIKWEGQGNIRISFDAQATFTGTNGRGQFNVTPGNAGLRLMITESNQQNPIRNIQLIVPGGVCGNSEKSLDPFSYCEKQSDCSAGMKCLGFESISWNRFKDPVSEMNNPKVVFHPTFLSRLRKYRALRFMDWMQTNDSKMREFSERADVKDQSLTTRKGAPYEYMVALSNLVNSDLWVTIPHQASNAYIESLAKLVKEQFRKDRKVYVEYSNETWNSIFDQYRWLVDQGERLKLASDSYSRNRAFHARRTVEMAKIWQTVFDERYQADPKNRVQVVLAAQSANSYWTDRMLQMDSAFQYVDVIAIAPYFGGGIGSIPSQYRQDRTEILERLTVNDVFKEIGEGGVLPHYDSSSRRYYKSALEFAREQIAQHVALAKRRRLSLAAYEGGQHLVAVGNAKTISNLTETLMAANRDPRMKEIYKRYLTAWKVEGGELFMHFSHAGQQSVHGSWGALLYQTQSQAQVPKFDALMDFIQNNRCWWTGCLIR